MELKRVYDTQAPSAQWPLRTVTCASCNGKGAILNDDATGILPCPDCHGQRSLQVSTPPLRGIRVHHTGTQAAQHFSTGMVEAGIMEGWMVLGQGQLVLKTEPEELVYTIRRVPGRYCCHCHERLEDDANGECARAHVRQRHPSAISPDPRHPAGYERVNAYECLLDDATQARWNAAVQKGVR